MQRHLLIVGLLALGFLAAPASAWATSTIMEGIDGIVVPSADCFSVSGIPPGVTRDPDCISSNSESSPPPPDSPDSGEEPDDS